MAIELNSDKVICSKCGRAYGKRQGNFSTSYASLHKGIGSLPICKTCVDTMYNSYLSQCHNTRDAVRQMCRKLDLYWSDKIYELVEKKSSPRSIMSLYITKVNSTAYAGKCYDDTLSDEGVLWSFGSASAKSDTSHITEDTPLVDDKVRAFWGDGYTPDMYSKLEQRWNYYISKLPNGTELDIGAEALLRQLCNLEVTVAKDSSAEKAIDKSINSISNLLAGLNLKPAQKKDDGDAALANTPLGVWLYRYENERPLPDVDDDLKDANHIRKYVFTWLGHICKMLGLKNAYSKLYEDEIARLRVDKPEYDEDDDETFMNELFLGANDGTDTGGVEDGGLP